MPIRRVIGINGAPQKRGRSRVRRVVQDRMIRYAASNGMFAAAIAASG